MSSNKSKRKRGGKERHGQGGGLSRRWTWALVAAVAIGFAAFVLEPVWRPMLLPAMSPALSPAEQIAQGETLYGQHCATCHGVGAVGQVMGQPNGGQRADGTYIAPALNGTAHAWHHAPQQLFQTVKYGSPAADSPMKGMQGKMTDREIESVLAFVQSLWPDTIRMRYQTMHRRG